MGELGSGVNLHSAAAAPIDKASKKKPDNPVAKLFTLGGFRLPNKRTVFVNDDKTETVKLAYVDLTLNGLFKITGSIYSAMRSDAAGRFEEIYLSMPSSGKGFPRPVFEALDPDTQAHYDGWRTDIAEQYIKWAASLAKSAKKGERPAQSTGRITRRLPDAALQA